MRMNLNGRCGNMRGAKRYAGLLLLCAAWLLSGCASRQSLLAPGETLNNDSGETAWVLMLKKVPPGTRYVNSGADTLKVIPNQRLLYLYLRELLRESRISVEEEKLRALDDQLRETRQKLEALEKQ